MRHLLGRRTDRAGNLSLSGDCGRLASIAWIDSVAVSDLNPLWARRAPTWASMGNLPSHASLPFIS